MAIKKRIIKRTAALFIIFIIICIYAIGKLSYLQIFDKERFANQAFSQRLRPNQIDARRGNIYDRNFNILAMSADAHSVYVISSDKRDSVLAAQQLTQVLPMTQSEIENKLETATGNFWLARKLTPAMAETIERFAIPGIRLISRPQRFYPQEKLAAQVLGFAGVDNQGLEGLEYYYNDILAGVPGTLEIERDAAGRVIPGGSETFIAPENGKDLILTLDNTIQYIAEKELESAVKSSDSVRGVIIIVRPQTGEILANAIYPAFDPNNYQSYATANWRNIAVTDNYEPGSTFKVFTAAAALDANIVDAERTFYSGQSWSVGGGVVSSSNGYGYGNISFKEAIESSDNITFAQLSVELGPERFYPYLRNFGFGERLSVDFPGEASGILSRPGSVSHGEQLQWANIGFGQGVAMTPLQLVMATAAIANQGSLMRPYYVAQIRDDQGKILKKTEPQEIANPISKQTATVLTSLLRSAVANGTGARAEIVGFAVAGKTGTAEVPEQGGYGDKRIASFVGYAPYDNPEVVALVVLYYPESDVRYGGTLAAPIFQTVVEQTLDYLGTPRAGTHQQQTSLAVVPNVRNYPLSEARKMIAESNLRYNMQNTGQIVREQIPNPGTKVTPQTTINLFFYEDSNSDQVQVPDVSGKSMRDAALLIQEQGLRLNPVGSGMAIRQTPSANATVQRGSVVEVEFMP